MTGLRLAARRWHTSIRKNLLRERRTRCTAKWACHSLVESNDPVGNLTRPLLLVSNAPFNFYAFHRSLLIKTPAFAIVSSNLSFTREKGKIPSFAFQISYRLKILRTIRKGIELVTGEECIEGWNESSYELFRHFSASPLLEVLFSDVDY